MKDWIPENRVKGNLSYMSWYHTCRAILLSTWLITNIIINLLSAIRTNTLYWEEFTQEGNAFFFLLFFVEFIYFLELIQSEKRKRENYWKNGEFFHDKHSIAHISLQKTFSSFVSLPFHQFSSFLHLFSLQLFLWNQQKFHSFNDCRSLWCQNDFLGRLPEWHMRNPSALIAYFKNEGK